MSVLAPLPLMQQIRKQNAMPSNTSYIYMPILVAKLPSPPVIILPWTRICATSNLLGVGHSQTHLFSHRWPQLPPREGDLGHWNHFWPFACFTAWLTLVNILPFLGVGQSPIDQPLLTTTSWANYPLCRYKMICAWIRNRWFYAWHREMAQNDMLNRQMFENTIVELWTFVVVVVDDVILFICSDSLCFYLSCCSWLCVNGRSFPSTINTSWFAKCNHLVILLVQLTHLSTRLTAGACDSGCSEFCPCTT